ncbi:hypothetical protein AVEN_143055-1 [Araneus ventricosus]|uniref:Helitron helicase-like domain-containing protein n=1 Tax=Araneus ventricosus TaxID=182803 RepID=A0A4Y2X974_ARAVE|nr:hypothetical protein AVEN_143055-1 [Araneus ventricosus]
MGDENTELNRRCQNIQGVERDTVLKIQRILHEHSHLINTFKTSFERMPGEDYKLVIHPDRTPSREHERRYNAPLINDAALVTNGQFATRDIVIQAHNDKLTKLPETHKFYDALHPRKLQKETIHNENGYPQYRRRSSADGGQTSIIKLRNGDYTTVDNSWVVPYSSILTKMFNAHINVEACSSYLPTKNYSDRIFEVCRRDDFAKSLLYVEVTRYYTWNTSTRKWKRRIHGTPVQNWPGVKSGDALGRVYTVHTSNMECFYLRMLLHHVRGPTSFGDLKRHNQQELSTFREACEQKGLIENDNHWDLTVEEANAGRRRR